MSARVFLGNVLVGELTPDVAAQATSFEFDPSYARNAARPVLGRWFEDRAIERQRTFRGSPLPSFFRNLLPEGALRKMVEARLGASALPEYAMLLRLGEQLPGAVRIVSDELEPDAVEDSERHGRTPGDPFRFALTGVQAKLSLAEDKDRLSVPLEGNDGYWIAKFGSAGFRDIVQNELTMLSWAQACGLDVPEHRLISAREIEHLPDEFEPDQDVLIVRRFDREPRGARIHQEDFAQVFGVAPEERYVTEVPDYGNLHFGTMGAVIHALCGNQDYREYLRRLVFMVLSGNADAHVKNWALIYRDGLRARLAPVYDFVATVVYRSLPQHPALRWSEPPEPTMAAGHPLVSVTMNDLLITASYTEADTAEILDDLSAFVSMVRSTWKEVASTAPSFIRERITEHLARSPLV